MTEREDLGKQRQRLDELTEKCRISAITGSVFTDEEQDELLGLLRSVSPSINVPVVKDQEEEDQEIRLVQRLSGNYKKTE